MGVRFLLLSFILGCLCLTACKNSNSNTDIEIEFTQDTLQVPFTYWWEESGPFIGYCGENYSLVFVGTITDLETENKDAGPLYHSKRGTIALEKVLKIDNPNSQEYISQGYVTTDCFYGLDLTVGDKVLVFCYEYEDGFSIAGGSCIIDIGGLEHPLVKSIKTYIHENQDPLAIEKDSTLWGAYGFGEKLAQHIRCKENPL
ncbi:hypothetical protein B0O79_2096 [Flavobacteriaceae bacterium MAR_2009_75]|nr:hypothetical protein B0O79_2096 [Flavobacteriaceae bacterium MAR_2009_75]